MTSHAEWKRRFAKADARLKPWETGLEVLVWKVFQDRHAREFGPYENCSFCKGH